MTFSRGEKAASIGTFAVVFSLILLPNTEAAGIGIFTAVNRCGFKVTVFSRAPAGKPTAYNIPAGGSTNLVIPANLASFIWGSQSGNNNSAQCTQLFIFPNSTSPRSGSNVRNDLYAVTVMQAYNIGLEIQPTYLANGDHVNGTECGSPACSIKNINSVCQNGNYFAGPDNACINANNSPLFRTACPLTGIPNICNTGSNYNITFCPSTTGITRGFNFVI